MEGKMGKMQTITPSQLEREIRAGHWQLEDECNGFAILMDCETFRQWTVRVATWEKRAHEEG
jgi:hypothetical protein